MSKRYYFSAVESVPGFCGQINMPTSFYLCIRFVQNCRLLLFRTNNFSAVGGVPRIGPLNKPISFDSCETIARCHFSNQQNGI